MTGASGGWPSAVTAGIGRILARYAADLAVEFAYLCQVRRGVITECVDQSGAIGPLPQPLWSLAGRIQDRGALLMIDDLDTDSVLVELGTDRPRGAFLGVGSFDTAGVLIGMLLAHGHSPRQWTNRDLERAGDTSQGAAALLMVDDRRRHAERRVQVEVQARRVRAQMYNISAQSAFASSLPELSRVLVRELPQLLGASWALVGVRHADSGWRVYVDPEHEEELAGALGGDESTGDLLLDEISEFTDRQELNESTAPSWPRLRDRLTTETATVHGATLSSTDDLAMVVLCGFSNHDLDLRSDYVFDEMVDDARRVVDRTAAAQRQIRAASALQRSLLPPRLPALTGFEIGRLYKSAADHTRVGGDWYDIVKIDAVTTGFVVGDVAGHDIRSAALMGQVRHVLASQLRDRRRPAGAVTATDRYFADLDESVMATAVVIVVDQSTNVAHVALAGHPPPVLISEGASSLFTATPGPPIGFGIGGYHDTSHGLGRDDIVIAYTDGVVETRTGDLSVLLDDFVRSLDGERSVDELIAALDERSRRGELVDDVAALVVRIT